jgi:hypothetical protein
MGKPVKREPKKPYSKPKLTVYGTVYELTKTLGHSGNLDGQTIPLRPNKTHI